MKEVRDPDALRVAMAERRGLSHAELAKLADTSRPMVSAVLAGKRCSPAVARRIAKVLRVRVDLLFQVAESSGELSDVQSGAVA